MDLTCSMENCPNTARWHPVLELRHSKKGTVTLGTYLQIRLCNEHKEKANLADFLSDEGFTKISKHTRENGKGAPLQRNTTLNWTPVTPGEKLPTDTLLDPVASGDLAF
jgi:hypothetical protein